MGTEHVLAELLAYAEGRLAPAERARVEAHVAVCPACRAQADDLHYLVDALSAVPRALDVSLAPRRSQAWATVWSRVRAQPARAARAHGRLAWSMALAAGLLVISALLLSPFQDSALAASGPALVAIQTPSPDTTLTLEPSSHPAGEAFDTTATLTLGQTPAPNPNP
jgi:anti-sigma factor RsiW